MDRGDNEFAVLEFIHNFVETLTAYFENVAEIDIIFNLDKVLLILDELVVDGCIVEGNKMNVLPLIEEVQRSGSV
ncbi:AP-4 complex subunit sigma-1 [Quaeritorhiza haematococci]|nr:AP-4 complex subunit sigma-1 [Quaeritorhiza haematococci]